MLGSVFIVADEDFTSGSPRTPLTRALCEVWDDKRELQMWLPLSIVLEENDPIKDDYRLVFRMVPPNKLPARVIEWYLKGFAEWRCTTGTVERKRIFGIFEPDLFGGARQPVNESPIRRGFRFVLARVEDSSRVELSLPCQANGVDPISYESFAPLSFVHYYDEECIVDASGSGYRRMAELAASVCKTYQRLPKLDLPPDPAGKSKALVFIDRHLLDVAATADDFDNIFRNLCCRLRTHMPRMVFGDLDDPRENEAYANKLWVSSEPDIRNIEVKSSRLKIDTVIAYNVNSTKIESAYVGSKGRTRIVKCPRNPIVVSDLLLEEVFADLRGHAR